MGSDDAFFAGLAAFCFVLCLAGGAGWVIATLAARKGYKFWMWFWAGGILGLLVLCLLPFANDPNLSYSEQCNLAEKGNNTGRILVVINAVFVLIRMLTAM